MNADKNSEKYVPLLAGSSRPYSTLATAPKLMPSLIKTYNLDHLLFDKTDAWSSFVLDRLTYCVDAQPKIDACIANSNTWTAASLELRKRLKPFELSDALGRSVAHRVIHYETSTKYATFYWAAAEIDPKFKKLVEDRDQLDDLEKARGTVAPRDSHMRAIERHLRTRIHILQRDAHKVDAAIAIGKAFENAIFGDNPHSRSFGLSEGGPVAPEGLRSTVLNLARLKALGQKWLDVEVSDEGSSKDIDAAASRAVAGKRIDFGRLGKVCDDFGIMLETPVLRVPSLGHTDVPLDQASVKQRVQDFLCKVTQIKSANLSPKLG